MKILISAANSDISISIARILRMIYPHSMVIGIAPDGAWPGKNFYDVMKDIPFISDKENYLNNLNYIMDEYKIDLFIPISEKEIGLLSTLEIFQENKNVLINSKSLVDVCLDKFKTYLWLKEINVPVPESHLATEEEISLNDPAIAKLRKSAGSKNIFSIKDQASLTYFRQEYADELDNYIIQRKISDINQEYTCALWRHDNDFRYLILHRKLQGGLTGEAQVVENANIENALNKIQKNIEGDFFINVQLRLENEIPYVFEINPRFSSTLMMRHLIGFQDLAWTIKVKLNLNVPLYSKVRSGTRIYRLAQELVVEKES